MWSTTLSKYFNAVLIGDKKNSDNHNGSICELVLIVRGDEQK